jgi:hypothetical protein
VAEEKKIWVKITNKGPGPRMVLLPTDGKTIQKNASVVLQLTENDYKGLKPYVDIGHLVLSEPTDDEIDEVRGTTNQDIGGEPAGDISPADPLKSGNPVDAASEGGEGDIIPASAEDDDDEGLGDDNEDGPTHVEHRGFGRYYGMRGDEKITAAMTENEANAYAEEHNLQAPVAPNPADEEPAAEPAASLDNAEDDVTASETEDPAADADPAAEEAPVSENETTA